MKKKGYLSIEAILVGAAILTMGVLLAGAIAGITGSALNGAGNFADNAIQVE